MQLRLHVTPGSRVTRLAWTEADALELRSSAAPREGAANADVIAQLSAALKVPKSSLVIVAGLKSREKVVAAGGLSADAILARLTSFKLDPESPS